MPQGPGLGALAKPQPTKPQLAASVVPVSKADLSISGTTGTAPKLSFLEAGAVPPRVKRPAPLVAVVPRTEAESLVIEEQLVAELRQVNLNLKDVCTILNKAVTH